MSGSVTKEPEGVDPKTPQARPYAHTPASVNAPFRVKGTREEARERDDSRRPLPSTATMQSVGRAGPEKPSTRQSAAQMPSWCDACGAASTHSRGRPTHQTVAGPRKGAGTGSEHDPLKQTSAPPH